MPIRAFAARMAAILPQIPAPAKIISALSGGMDSVALLHLLVEWRRNNDMKIPLVAAHLNHGLRGRAADGDALFARGLAESLGVEFAEETVDVAGMAKAEGRGLEDAGRRARYGFFHRLGGTDALVLTGHHADDQAETILLNLRRGAHRRGLSGMRELAWVAVQSGIRVRVARPLLSVPREKILSLATERGWRWREDESNADTEFLRNRVRHRILPTLERLIPGFRERLLERARILAKEEEAWTERGRALTETATRREGGGRFFRIAEKESDAAPVDTNPEELLYAFRHVVEEELASPLPYGAALSRLAELAEQGRLGETVTLPGSLRVRRERDGLFFFFPSGEKENSASRDEILQSGILLPPPSFRIRTHGLAVSASREDYQGGIPEPDRNDPNVQWLNPASLHGALRLRAPLPGERFRAIGSPGGRKIQDILVDAKIPRRKRGVPRVVADDGGAVWVWPLRLAHRVRMEEGMRHALRMEIREITDPSPAR